MYGPLRAARRGFAAVAIVLTPPALAAQPACPMAAPTGPVQAPLFVTNLAGQTSWFASPVVVDLDHDGANELGACRA